MTLNLLHLTQGTISYFKDFMSSNLGSMMLDILMAVVFIPELVGTNYPTNLR